jgi:hypothetical protein
MPVPPEAITVELYATPNWMAVAGAHKTDIGGLGGAAEAGFAGSCGDAAAEMTARKTDRIAVLMNVPLRYGRQANAVCILRSQRQRLLTHIIVYSIRRPG